MFRRPAAIVYQGKSLRLISKMVVFEKEYFVCAALKGSKQYTYLTYDDKEEEYVKETNSIVIERLNDKVRKGLV